jgi:ankyrin repeat protein
MPETLPARPALDWYRKAARKKLVELRASDPQARLAQAQLAIAREHGFASWRKLKARIDELAVDLPALFAAIRGDDQPLIRRMLEEKPELANVRDAEGQSALHVAAADNNPDAIDLLLARNADARAHFGHSAHTALSWALTTRSFDSAAALVRGGVQPDLFCAAGMGDVARVRASFDDRGNVLPGASWTGSSRFAPDGTRQPTPPRARREIVADALYLACRNGQADVVRELLTHDPELSFRAFLGATPLHWAYFGARREVIDMLLAAGADPALRDHEYRCTPRPFGICVAASWGFMSPFMAVLKNDPGSVNVLDGRGTALHEAARAGQEAVVEILLQVGADPSCRDPDGKTPLDLALAGGHEGVVRRLRSR